MKKHILGSLLGIGVVTLALLNPLGGKPEIISSHERTGNVNLAESGPRDKAESKSHRDNADLALEVARLKKELAWAKTELATLKKERAKSVLAAHPAREATGQPPPPTPEETAAAAETLQRLEAESDERMQHTTEYLASSFAGEPVEPQWAQSATALIRNAWQNIPTESASLAALECHTTLCRLEIEYTQEALAGEVESRLLFDLGTQLSQVLRQTENALGSAGSRRVTLYMAREGFQLPTPEGMI